MFDAFVAMGHNYKLIKQAENIITDFISDQSEDRKSGVYLVNPDGTKVKIQPGFYFESYEFAPFKNNNAKL